MVECAQHPPDALDSDAVVERRCRVADDQRRAEDTAGHDVPDVAVQRGKRCQHGQAGDCQHDAGAMGHAVGDFLAEAVLGQCRQGTHRRSRVEARIASRSFPAYNIEG
jgi:hypothetical protein